MSPRTTGSADMVKVCAVEESMGRCDGLLSGLFEKPHLDADELLEAMRVNIGFAQRAADYIIAIAAVRINNPDPVVTDDRIQ